MRLFPAILLLSLSSAFAEDTERKKPIEKDLVLSAKLVSKDTIRSGEKIEVSSPPNVLFRVETQGVGGPEYSAWRGLISLQPDKRQSSYDRETRLIKPKEELNLLGDGEFAKGRDGNWFYSTTQNIKVRAAYSHTRWEPYSHSLIQSQWVELKVEASE